MGLLGRLKKAPILLGSRRVRREKRQFKGGATEIDEDEDWDYAYDLLVAEKVVVADDTNAYQLFGDVIFTCPQEDFLEGLSFTSIRIWSSSRSIRFLHRIGISPVEFHG